MYGCDCIMKGAGYDLRELVDADIKMNKRLY